MAREARRPPRLEHALRSPAAARQRDGLEKAFEDELEEALGGPLDEEPKGGWPKFETSRDRLEWMAKEIEEAGEEERAMQEAEDGLNQESDAG